MITCWLTLSNNKCELWRNSSITNYAAMLTKVMPDIYKSVWGFLCMPYCVRRLLYILGYIQFIEKSIACTKELE